MSNLRIHPVLRDIAAVFTAAGKEVYLVGGAVRDLLLGRDSADWDLSTNARPEEVMGLFRKVIATGIKHGTVTIRWKGISLEVTTFRTESAYSDGRRPDQVRYAATIAEDLSRRDFTMNAAAVRLPDGLLSDPFGGRDDIKRRIIRCVGAAEERFAEDGLRPLRALRFASQLGFDLDRATAGAIHGALPTTAKVAPERIRDELDKIIASPNPLRAFRLMEETEMLHLLLPELAACRGVEQGGYHHFDVLDHSFLACDWAAKKGFSKEVRLAALLHDTGKPLVRRKKNPDETPGDSPSGGGAYTFYNHERESGKLAFEVMSRFRYPNAVTEKVLRLVREHMFHYEENWTDAAVRRFIIRAGTDLIPELTQLHLADTAGTTGAESDPAALLPLLDRIEAVLEKGKAISLKDLAVNGRDLIALGVAPGKYVGIILNELLDAVIEDPALNSREKLLEIAGNITTRYRKASR
ncbi:MAG: HD domain-containing protein [Treponema sp.]|jgi:tRNA nucleotidyltransferase/poly(A) polymerase|nr:HD domain-containing protein [Treponema sp.]